jgi:hypothetical protein
MSTDKTLTTWAAIKDALLPEGVESYVIVAIDTAGQVLYGAKFPTAQPGSLHMSQHLARAAEECAKTMKAVKGAQ